MSHRTRQREERLHSAVFRIVLFSQLRTYSTVQLIRFVYSTEPPPLLVAPPVRGGHCLRGRPGRVPEGATRAHATRERPPPPRPASPCELAAHSRRLVPSGSYPPTSPPTCARGSAAAKPETPTPGPPAGERHLAGAGHAACSFCLLSCYCCCPGHLLFRGGGCYSLVPSPTRSPSSLTRSSPPPLTMPPPLPYDAVVVPGGGLTLSGDPHPWVAARLDAAAAVTPRPPHFLLLSRGTPHRPPPTHPRLGTPIDEAAASAAYLVATHGVDRRVLRLDGWSLDTIGNAYFCRVALAGPLRLARLLVITNAFHAPRCRALFEWVFGLPAIAGGPPPAVALDWQVVPDVGMEPAARAARVRKEEAGLAAAVGGVMASVTDLAGLAAFVFGDHAAYAAAPAEAEASRTPCMDDEARGTY